MTEPSISERIRTIFLHEQPYVSTREAAELLGWSRNDMSAAIEASEIETKITCSGRRIPIEEVAAKALEQWPLEVIEEALGREAALVLPPELRTQHLAVRLPRYQVAMLRVLAEQRQTSVGHVVARQLEYLAEEHLHEMMAAIPGFGDAYQWPDIDEANAS